MKEEKKALFALAVEVKMYCLAKNCVNNIDGICNLKCVSNNENGVCNGMVKLKIKKKKPEEDKP